MESFVEEALRSEKIFNKSLILDKYESINKFLCDFLDYIYKRTNERTSFNDIEFNNIEKYLEKYNDYDEIIFDKMKMISDRAQELNKSSNNTDKKKLRNISNYMGGILNSCEYDSSKTQIERAEIGHVLDMLIFENNDMGIFDVINSSDKIYKYKYKDGELIINKALRFLKESLSKDYYESANYYSRVVFELLKKDTYKIDSICNDLREYKKTINDKEKCKIILSLIDRITLIGLPVISMFEKENYEKKFKHNYCIHNDFPKDVETKANLIYSRSKSVVDLRNRNIITIDQKYKTAFDDAISIEKNKEGYLFSIYITDVASFIDIDSMLYKIARERGESIYGDTKNSFYIPMFPVDITRELFSLNKEEDKYAVVYDFYFSDDFDFIKFKFYNGLIRVNNNYTFDSIEHIKNGDINYDMIYMLMKITDELSYVKNKKYHCFKEKNNKHSIDNSIGSEIISTATIYLNTYIADFFSKVNYPLIYRTHDNFFCNDNFRSREAKELIRKCSTSGYSSVPKPHPVNNNKPYAQVTNPMRSYASFLNQYLFSYLMLDWNKMEDLVKFRNYWNDNLIYIVDYLNKRLEINKEFLSVMNELDSKRLTKK